LSIAPGCVLVARECEQEKGARILVPFDGSDGSRQVLNALTGLFDLASAEITLLHAVETHWLGIKPEEEELSQEPETDPDEASLLMELRREGEQVLSEARARLLEHHAGVTTLLREGDPANEILSETEQGEYNLVVLDASGSADLKDTMLGSVSSKVTCTAQCSVLPVAFQWRYASVSFIYSLLSRSDPDACFTSMSPSIRLPSGPCSSYGKLSGRSGLQVSAP
jgi:nucleotide-binding universal stress UspA family protein